MATTPVLSSLSPGIGGGMRRVAQLTPIGSDVENEHINFNFDTLSDILPLLVVERDFPFPPPDPPAVPLVNEAIPVETTLHIISGGFKAGVNGLPDGWRHLQHLDRATP